MSTSQSALDQDATEFGAVTELRAISPSLAAHVELAYQTTDGGCLLWGWLFDPDAIVDEFVLIAGERIARISERSVGREAAMLERVERRDVSTQLSNLGIAATDMHGFLIYSPRSESDMRLAVRSGAALGQIPLTKEQGLDRVRCVLDNLASHHGGALTSLCGRYGLEDPMLLRYFKLTGLPRSQDVSGTGKFGVDAAIPLGDAGLLVFGWSTVPTDDAAYAVLAPDGQLCPVTDALFPLERRDVYQAHREAYPELSEWCGFLLVASLPTYRRDIRALRVRGQDGDGLLHVPTTEHEGEGLALAKAALRILSRAGSLRQVLHAMFDKGLGQALESLRPPRLPSSPRYEERAFGQVPVHPKASVIVRLSGRCEWLRHQLAQFARDPDFRGLELIYVVDDPTVLQAALELSAACHGLFEVPFRVIWYGRSQGSAAAHNVAVRASRGDVLVFLKQEVIPMHPGWASSLSRALETLPAAGAVAPLLFFEDNMIEHAGVVSRRSERFPGFLSNHHTGRGMPWAGGMTPTQHELLTAACLMLRKNDYLNVGGLDEGYLARGFDESDLCLVLRGQGRTLWLVPEARLWHLESPSQDVGENRVYSQLLTLYDAWRFEQKIERGALRNLLNLRA